MSIRKQSFNSSNIVMYVYPKWLARWYLRVHIHFTLKKISFQIVGNDASLLHPFIHRSRQCFFRLFSFYVTISSKLTVIPCSDLYMTFIQDRLLAVVICSWCLQYFLRVSNCTVTDSSSCVTCISHRQCQ